MVSLSKLSTINHPHTLLALLLQLLSVKSHTNKQTSCWVARSGEKGPSRTSRTIGYALVCSNSSTGSNGMMMAFGDSTMLVNRMFLGCGPTSLDHFLALDHRSQPARFKVCLNSSYQRLYLLEKVAKLINFTYFWVQMEQTVSWFSGLNTVQFWKFQIWTWVRICCREHFLQ